MHDVGRKNISQSEDTTSSLFCCKMEIDQFLAKSCKVCQAWHDPLPHFIKCLVLPYLPLPPYGLKSFMDSPLSNMAKLGILIISNKTPP